MSRPLPSVEEAHENLQHAPGVGAVAAQLEVRTAVLGATAQIDAARTIAGASAEAVKAIVASSDALKTSVDALSAASNENTEVMSRWAKATAQWTMWLTLATAALLLTTVIQLIILVARR